MLIFLLGANRLIFLLGANRPGAKRLRGRNDQGRNDLGRNAAGAKRLGGELDLGRNDPDSSTDSFNNCPKHSIFRFSSFALKIYL